MSNSSISKTDIDVLVRLASSSYEFRLPVINGAALTSFSRSFKTVGTHPSTQELMTKVDHAREALATSLFGGERPVVISAAETYIPLLQTVITTCIAQRDEARLDDPLTFCWGSALESKRLNKKTTYFQSEAMMYDFVMSVVSQAFAIACIANEDAKAETFPSASTNYKKAAGIMAFLSKEQLPKWASQGKDVFSAELPCEASMEVCEAFELYFLAMAQQMAVVTLLRRTDSTLNEPLVAKLALGVAEKLEAFRTTMRGKANDQVKRMDSSIFTFVESQIKIHRGLSQYFHSRTTWDKVVSGEMLTGYGSVITMQRDVVTSIGSISKSASKKRHSDVSAFLKQMKAALSIWEKDNTTIYFEQPPTIVPEEMKLQQSVFMAKPSEYSFDDNVAPVPLMLPARKMPLSSLLQGAIGVVRS